MIKKKKWRYYCEFCSKSGGSGGVMSTHEKHCTMNPNRVCRLCKNMEEDQPDMRELLAILPDISKYEYGAKIFGETTTMINIELLQKDFIQILQKLRELTNNCPNCIFRPYGKEAFLNMSLVLITKKNWRNFGLI